MMETWRIKWVRNVEKREKNAYRLLVRKGPIEIPRDIGRLTGFVLPRIGTTGELL
jgi:hypothetical protein